MSSYLDKEKKFSDFLKGRAIPLLRYSIAVVFLLFGFLKVIGKSPAYFLVERAIPWEHQSWIAIFLGYWEMAIGLFLFIRPLERIGLWMLLILFPAFFLPFVFYPKETFVNLEGHYICKNLILIASWLVLVSDLHRPK